MRIISIQTDGGANKPMKLTVACGVRSLSAMR